jgi:Flp pilus assembly protein CpaB
VSSRRTLILIGALVIGALAAFLTLNYVRGVESRSDQAAELVGVVVATGPLPKGTAADAAAQSGLIGIEQRRRADLPANAVLRMADIGGYTSTIDLAGGEVVTTAMFANTRKAASGAAPELEPGKVAITVQTEGAAGLGSNLQPGDRVNVLARACVDRPGDGGSGGDCPIVRSGAGAGDIKFTQAYGYILQNVRVIGIGTAIGEPVANPSDRTDPTAQQAAEEQRKAEAATGHVTLEVTLEEAALLANFKDADLYFTLAPLDYVPRPVPFVSDLSTLPGEAGEDSSRIPTS